MITELTPRTDQDSAWKEVLDAYFREFMELFYPEFARQIDWARGFEMLDKELQSITKDAEVSRRYVDKLVKVFSLEGKEQWVLFHVEIQGEKKDNFERRLFEYSYRLYDKYQKPVATLVILTDTHQEWRPEHYQLTFWGKPIFEFHFFTRKLLDYTEQATQLAELDNPFGLIIQAQQGAAKTQRNPENRYLQKIALTRVLYDRGFSREKVLILYKFIDWVMALPEPLEIRYNNDIHAIEQERAVSYITSAERIGIQQGIQRGEADLLLTQLQCKFSLVPEIYQNKIAQADAKTLLVWGKRLMSATTLEAVFTDTNQH